MAVSHRGAISFGMVFYCYVTQSLDMSFWHYQFPPARMGEYFLGMILGFCARPTKARIPEGKLGRAGFTVLEIAVLLFWYPSFSVPVTGTVWKMPSIPELVFPWYWVC